MQSTLRIHRNTFWDHLTLPNIGNCSFDLQNSTLGTTIGPRNLPFRPGFPPETFWILDSCFWILDCGSWILDSDSWFMIYKLILKTNQKNIDPSNTNWIPEPEQCNSAIFLRLGDVYLESWWGCHPPEVQVLCHQSQFIPEQPIQPHDNSDYANPNIRENYGCQAGEDQRQFQGQILIVNLDNNVGKWSCEMWHFSIS